MPPAVDLAVVVVIGLIAPVEPGARVGHAVQDFLHLYPRPLAVDRHIKDMAGKLCGWIRFEQTLVIVEAQPLLVDPVIGGAALNADK